MSDLPPPQRRSLPDVVLDQVEEGGDNVVVFKMRADGSGATFAELADEAPAQ